MVFEDTEPDPADTVGMAAAKLAVVRTTVRATEAAGVVPKRPPPQMPESWLESMASFVYALIGAIRDPNVKSLIRNGLAR
jgi:hypothetical protein